MYYLAKKDENITENERSMLDLQARSYGITEEEKPILRIGTTKCWKRAETTMIWLRNMGRVEST